MPHNVMCERSTEQYEYGPRFAFYTQAAVNTAIHTRAHTHAHHTFNSYSFAAKSFALIKYSLTVLAISMQYAMYAQRTHTHTVQIAQLHTFCLLYAVWILSIPYRGTHLNFRKHMWFGEPITATHNICKMK